jgi:phosphopantothenoylcysteine decarboxylase/phosphopantothenate--cysteine ligase
VAAVSDWRAKDQAADKLPKADGPPKLKLEATPDILASVGAKKTEGQFVVGFSLETDEQKLASKEKLTAKNLDLLVANNPMLAGSEFGGDSNDAILTLRDGTVERPGLLSKHDLANRILDRVAAGLATKTKAAV